MDLARHDVLHDVLPCGDAQGDCQDEWPSTFITKLEDTYNIDSCPVNFTLKLAIMFIWTWMRALQIDPKHGRLQRQSQVCLYGCTVSMCVQTSLIILMPL